MSVERICGNCRYFEECCGVEENSGEQSESGGICKRFPPVYCGPPVAEDRAITLDWMNWSQPAVTDSHWCGEFVAKDAPPDPPKEIESRSIGVLGLSVRSRKAIMRLDAQKKGVSYSWLSPLPTVGELLKMTEVELLSQKNFGMSSLVEIRDKLASHGLKLQIGEAY